MTTFGMTITRDLMVLSILVIFVLTVSQRINIRSSTHPHGILQLLLDTEVEAGVLITILVEGTSSITRCVDECCRSYGTGMILCSPSPSPGNFAYFAPNLKQTHQIEQHLPGMASSAVIDELKDYILALNSFVIEAESKNIMTSHGKYCRGRSTTQEFCEKK
ncbi:unnamed protein product [Allacma fusca]|uniref:Uncharacterized protein n=1 Tax=Allacma fusca TaxID=39272 RepID=A0A8J2JSL9_9HEXA|nr:unnamed protein product [Allacma fusca]